MKLISELKEGDRVVIQVLVYNSNKLSNAEGKPYYNFTIKDCSGEMNAKKWEVNDRDEKIFVSGNAINLAGEVIKYRDTLQFRVGEASLLKEEEIDITRFVKAPPIDKNILIEKFNKFVNSIKNSDCKLLLDYFVNKYKDKLFIYPAAHSIHHDYSSGLLMHITSMASIADFLANEYENVDRDLLITGVLLHDIGKLTELEGPIIFNYTLEGQLLGHISIMCAEIKIAAKELNITSEVPLLLEHMILSHHGQLEFGSPVLPLTKEAMILSMIDNLDSRINIIDKAYENVEPGEFTQRVFALDNRMFYKKK